MTREKKCWFCLQLFVPKNSKGKFCSIRCRVAFFRAKRKSEKAQITKLSQQLPVSNSSEIDELNRFSEVLNRR